MIFKTNKNVSILVTDLQKDCAKLISRKIKLRCFNCLIKLIPYFPH